MKKSVDLRDAITALFCISWRNSLEEALDLPRAYGNNCREMKRLLLPAIAGFLFSVGATPAFSEDGPISHYDSDPSGASRAVRVKRGGLAHTSMFTVSESKPGEEMAALISQIEEVAKELGSDFSGVAKLNLFVADESPALLDQIKAQLVNSWPAGKRPALTVIPTPLPENAKIAGDAVIHVESDPMKIKRIEGKAAVMPSGRDMIYISGRAASGELPEATSGTMEQLFAVLEHLSASRKDVIQVKAFIRPMSGWEIVKEEIEKSFGDAPVPPLVFVEWSSSSRATEIELIAAAPDRADTKMSVSYFTPPGEKSSPVYSRVARVYSDEIVYISGTTAPAAESPEEEVNGVFQTLKSSAEKAGSGLLHFVKATYYVSDATVSAKFNELRPEYYDPERPPAASKVAVPTVGPAGRGLLVDMVAVPAR